ARTRVAELPVSGACSYFIISVSPTFTAIMALALLGERFSGWAWFGTFVSFSGIGIIALGEGKGPSFDAGALLILGAAVCTAVTTIVQKPLFADHDPLSVAAWIMVLGAICLTPFLTEGFAEAGVADSAAIWSVVS